MLRFSTTETTQRVGELDLSSFIEQTNSVTGEIAAIRFRFMNRCSSGNGSKQTVLWHRDRPERKASLLG